MEYRAQSNVKIEFKKSGGNEDLYLNLCGFLGEEGMTFSLTNRFQNALELGGSIFGQLQEIGVSVKAIAPEIGQLLGNIPGVKNITKGAQLSLSQTANSYISLGGTGNNIILNAPYHWQGTNPIEFDISLFQIADQEEDIINSYQRVLEILSPKFPYTDTQNQRGGQNKDVIGYGEGPGYAMVHYFPVDGQFKQNGEGSGTLILGPCLCPSVSMEIKAPYSEKYLPIIGAYRFHMQAARLLDRGAINKIFQGTSGPLLSTQPGKNGAMTGGEPWPTVTKPVEETDK
jgi:hypothetical protein